MHTKVQRDLGVLTVMRIVHLFIVGAVLGSLLWVTAAWAAESSSTPLAAHMLDASTPFEHGDQVLVCTLQGLVNRDAPRLFLRTHFGINPASDDFWIRYLTKEKNFIFGELPSLNAAIKYYREHGLIRGLVTYDDKNANASYAAAMLASQRGDLLPVTSRMLAYQTELLSGSENWTQDGMDTTPRWMPFSSLLQRTTDGLQVTSRPGQSKHSIQRRIDLDLDRMTAVEVVMPQVSQQWGLHITSGDMNAWIIAPTTQTGTVRAELKPTLSRNARRALLELVVIGDEATAKFTVRSLRFLGPDGATAKPATLEKTDCFKDLPIVEDLRGKFADESAAAQWSLEHQLAGSSKQLAFSADRGWWNFIAMDLAIATKAYVFYENAKGGMTRPMPINDPVLAHLEPPGAVFGWNTPEWIWCLRLSKAGHRLICATAPNLSFWRKVPLDGPIRFANSRQLSGPLAERYYVIFCNSDDDAPKTMPGLMKPECDFASPARGTVPINFGITPFAAEFAPGLVEFYAKHATPNDGFYCGASGLGYTNPSMMPNLEQFGRLTGEAMQRMNLPMVDIWDYTRVRPAELNRYFNPPTSTASPPVQWYIHNPTAGGPSDNRWLDDGTPVILGRYEHAEKTGLWAVTPRNLDRNDIPSDLVRRITAEADRHVPPYFILVYGHISPEDIATVAGRLPKERFAVINIGDATALTREAGAMTATPHGSGTGAGQSIAIELALRNPDGQTGNAGTITWKLPTGWTADLSEWRHPAIERRTTIRKTIVLTSPKDWNTSEASIEFHSDRLPWKRKVRLQRYAQSTTIADFTFSGAADQWVASDGGTLTVLPNGAARLTGTRHSSRLTTKLTIDFDHKPIIELNVPSMEAKGVITLVRGKEEKYLSGDKMITGDQIYDIAEKIGPTWTGKQEVELRVYPSWGVGQVIEVQWIKLHERLP